MLGAEPVSPQTTERVGSHRPSPMMDPHSDRGQNMNRLYTSLVIAKRELNGGTIPMTPVPKHIQHIINPDFVPGLGAFEEDAVKGLRCPVCGRFMHTLKNHMNTAHADIGGATEICNALSVPLTNSLTSAVFHEKMSRAQDPYIERTRQRNFSQRRGKATTGRRRRLNAQTVHHRNHRNSCEAQIQHRLWDLYHKIGRAPTMKEAVALGQDNLTKICVTLYGSWHAAIVTAGLTLTAKQLRYTTKSKEQVIAQYGEWFKVHGYLPTQTQVRNPQRLPLLSGRRTVCRVMKTKVWKEAMRRVALALGVWDYRYRPEPGSPSAPRYSPASHPWCES